MMRTWTWMIWRTTMRTTSMRHWAEIQPAASATAFGFCGGRWRKCRTGLNQTVFRARAFSSLADGGEPEADDFDKD